MKKFCLIVLTSVAFVSPALAQSSVWIANRSANSVTVTRENGGLPATLSGAPFNFNQPYDVATIPSRRLVAVSNFGASPGTVTLIDGLSRQFVALVTVTGSVELKGMSVSPDDSALFVAGRSASGPAVFRINLSTLTSSVAGQVIEAGNGAEDCCVVPAFAVGGAGNGPGKVYFTVTTSAPDGYIAVSDLLTPGVTSISTDTGTLANYASPTTLERTPDSRYIYVGCTAVFGTTTELRLIRIDPRTDAATTVLLASGIQLLSHEAIDTAWRTVGGTIVGYAVGVLDSGSPTVYRIDRDGVLLPGAPVTVGVSPVTTLRFNPDQEDLWFGEGSGTSTVCGYHDATGGPVSSTFNSVTSGGSGPRSMAFHPALQPDVVDVCPSGQVATAGAEIFVRGQGFFNGSVVYAGAGAGATPLPTTMISGQMLRADAGGLSPGIYNVIVRQPDLREDQILEAYLAVNPPGSLSSATRTLPSLADGYRMISFGQFATVADLRAAVQAQIGAYDPRFVRLVVWENGGYQDLSSLSPNDPCDFAGRAIWALSRFGGTLSVTSLDVAASMSAAAVDVHVMPLMPGWNMIAMPYDIGPGSAMDAQGVQFSQDGINYGPTLFDAATTGDLSWPIAYVNRSYVALDTSPVLLRAGQGYWVRNNLSSPVYLKFLLSDTVIVAGFSAAGSPLAAGSPVPPGVPSDADDSKSGSGCGLLGAEGLVVFLLAWMRARRRLPA